MAFRVSAELEELRKPFLLALDDVSCRRPGRRSGGIRQRAGCPVPRIILGFGQQLNQRFTAHNANRVVRTVGGMPLSAWVDAPRNSNTR